ncbi:L-alanine exporter AlaE [Mangrovitalea sediminis]|uniref:L-alanine exporter AlaE n=1 Tax=Mangrovitalea sediminis TaxID=1982043 RepID=UPI000BE58EC8|nr:L-alanine exporter AlaE [Mangrovitalea sediminis]
MKRYLADTFAMIVFSTVCGAFIEIVIAGLSVSQSMRIRVAAIPIILFAGRPYGLYRDWLFRLLSRDKNGNFKAAIIDTFANFSFQLTLYLILLFINDATIEQALKAGGAIVIFLIISGRPYGIFLSGCRKLFGVNPN